MRFRLVLLAISLWILLIPMTGVTGFGLAQTELFGNSYYVSRHGSNEDGLTWATAWNELDQIKWDIIAPGDTIFIDGGGNEMVYETSLAIGQSGTLDHPITIRASTEANHDGDVIMFGGRKELLPYCGQETYDNPPEDSVLRYGIRTYDHDYIVLDGSHWQGIMIHGFRVGMRIDAGSTHVTARYLNIFNNGTVIKNDDGWQPDNPGVGLGGSDITLQRVIIHDNGQDAIQSLSGDNNLTNFHLEQSWLYNGRKHPTINEAANFCTHTDGIQIFDGGVVSGLTISESIIGPGFTNGVILGQTVTNSGAQADVQDVVFRDVVFTKAADNNVLGYRNTSTCNWTLERVTLHCPNTRQQCLRIFNSNHSVIDSIIVGGEITFPDGLDVYAGNCIWKTTGFELGMITNPGFSNVSDTDYFSLDDYSVSPESNCQGSLITSVEDLFELE